MSRTDPPDFDYPLGLSSSRLRPHERDQNISAPISALGPLGQQDRRPSNVIASHGSFNGAVSRSWTPPEQRDHGYDISGPNRHNPTASLGHITNPSPLHTFNHHNHRPSPSPLHPANSHNAPGIRYSSSSINDRDGIYLRQAQAPNHLHASTNSLASRSTLWWGELEPWMDEEYAKQVCGLMGWDPVSIKVPHPAPDTSTGQQGNNPGYCFLTFPSPAHAASVLAQISNSGHSGKGAPASMPNSAKPFVMNWASSVAPASPVSTPFAATNGAQAAGAQQYPKEYSIFVGDLAPETSNSDLVAVFRNPVLGLRNDREPKFIRPFLSCKSAKIMLDPLTGVSRGYGFVRFTDEADQQRALIEMHGLYCLSRPMRISPATAKFKAPPLPPFDLPQVQFTPPVAAGSSEHSGQSVTIALPLPTSAQTKSVSAPIAAAGSNTSLNSNAGSNSGSSIGGSHSSNSLSSNTGSSASISTSAYGSLSTEDMMNLPNNVLAQLAQQYVVNSENNPLKMASASPYANDIHLRQVLAHQQNEETTPRYMVSEESWKHHAQARAILGNLIGPNGEQLTSTDPYNTTVFVGGLSPLISEDTLRTFFAPFGDIHYVKVPVGKHCGFVQFVRKVDAEKAIEKMQGFPIGGSRIRLSWGRSQYKAAQAAAQAAQAAALESQYGGPVAPTPGAITQEQALHLLQKFSLQNYPSGYDSTEIESALLNTSYNGLHGEQKAKKEETSSSMSSFQPRSEMHRLQSNFSPFSPDPNNLYTSSEGVRRDPGTPFSRLESLPHPSKAYAPGFYPLPSQELKLNTTVGGSQGKVSPTAARPPSATRYGFSETTDPPAPINRAPGRVEGPISRPSSGQTLAHVEIQEADLMHDLNGTLASLELDRSWKSPEAALPRTNSY